MSLFVYIYDILNTGYKILYISVIALKGRMSCIKLDAVKWTTVNVASGKAQVVNKHKLVTILAFGQSLMLYL